MIRVQLESILAPGNNELFPVIILHMLSDAMLRFVEVGRQALSFSEIHLNKHSV